MYFANHEGYVQIFLQSAPIKIIGKNCPHMSSEFGIYVNFENTSITLHYAPRRISTVDIPRHNLYAPHRCRPNRREYENNEAIIWK